jgi:hypothetical protein
MKECMNMRGKLLLVAALFASGCSTPMETRLQDKLADRPAAYREGYIAGCRSGQAEAAHSDGKEVKDASRIQSDTLYANGWYDGFEDCKNNYRPSARDTVKRQY